MEGKKTLPPFYVPRMVMEWKRRPDIIWTTRTGLGKYWQLLEGKVNIARCNAFVSSMRTRSEDDPYPSGEVEGVLVQYSSRYLHKFFDWDGTGFTEWSEACTHPRPDLAAKVGDLQKNRDGRYDVFALGKIFPEPWFSRMRGVLSQVYFRNDCNGITPEQLTILLMADQGEHINWGLLVDENFRVQLRGYRLNPAYHSPIGPFLTAYIAHYLAFYQRHNRGPLMGTFLDVQWEISQAMARDPALPSSSKRQRTSDVAVGEGTMVAIGQGSRSIPWTQTRAALTTCVDNLMKWLQDAEQDHAMVNLRYKEMEEQFKRKAAHTIRVNQEQAKKTMEEARTEFQTQLEEAQQTLANLRNRVTSLELELAATQDHVDILNKEKAWAQERITRLTQQNQESLAHCKTLENTIESLQQGSHTHTATQGANEDLLRLQQERLAAEQAKENFEANKVGWVHMAARTIAIHAYQLLIAKPPVTSEPPQEFLDDCIDNALAVLDLEHSDHEWESMEAELMSPMPDIPFSTQLNPVPTSPAPPHHEVPASSGLAILEHQAEHVDIPDHLTDVEATPPASPRFPLAVSAAPSQPTPTVQIRTKPFRYHKESLKRIEAEFNLEDPASDESEAEEELNTAIDLVKNYFVENPDLRALYSDPEADQVQCPACNRVLGKTVYDVYQHSVTSRSKHNLMHRGVAAAIASIYGDQVPPRRHAQVPREATRPDRRPAHRRTRG